MTGSRGKVGDKMPPGQAVGPHGRGDRVPGHCPCQGQPHSHQSLVLLTHALALTRSLLAVGFLGSHTGLTWVQGSAQCTTVFRERQNSLVVLRTGLATIQAWVQVPALSLPHHRQGWPLEAQFSHLGNGRTISIPQIMHGDACKGHASVEVTFYSSGKTQTGTVT